ncbi:hypothetical protein V8C86DRAFT_102731 [Haematococcus lacustris]
MGCCKTPVSLPAAQQRLVAKTNTWWQCLSCQHSCSTAWRATRIASSCTTPCSSSTGKRVAHDFKTAPEECRLAMAFMELLQEMDGEAWARGNGKKRPACSTNNAPSSLSFGAVWTKMQVTGATAAAPEGAGVAAGGGAAAGQGGGAAPPAGVGSGVGEAAADLPADPPVAPAGEGGDVAIAADPGVAGAGGPAGEEATHQAEPAATQQGGGGAVLGEGGAAGGWHRHPSLPCPPSPSTPRCMRKTGMQRSRRVLGVMTRRREAWREDPVTMGWRRTPWGGREGLIGMGRLRQLGGWGQLGGQQWGGQQ